MAAINKRLMTAPGSQRFISFMKTLGYTRSTPIRVLAYVSTLLFLIQFQDRHKCVLRDFHIPNHLQTFLALLLFLEQFLLAGNIAAITFRQHILARGLDVGARDHASARGGLNSHIE